MKKLMMTAIMLSISHGYAQTTNWTFQWHGQTLGLYFEVTNLTKSVKAAIRDDVALVMSNIAVAETEIHPIQPDDPDLGKVDGLMNILADGRAYPDDFPIGDYRMVNGTPFFLLSEEECSAYASAVALTNQYATQLSKMPAVIWKFTNGFDVANMTLKQKEQYIWNPKFAQMKKDNITEYEADITEALPKGTNWITVLKPSVLSYSKEDLERNGKELLVCRLCIRVNRTPPTPFTLILVFKDGAWRWCPEIF